LREAVLEADPREVRELLREMVTKVELWFDYKKMPGKTRSVFRRGVIYVRPQGDDGLTSDLCTAASPTPAAPGAPPPGVPAAGPAPGSRRRARAPRRGPGRGRGTGARRAGPAPSAAVTGRRQ